MYHVWCFLQCVWITTRASTAVGAYARLGGPVTVTWAMSPIKEFKVMKDYRVVFQITGSNKVTVADKELRTRINGDSLSYTRGTFSFQLHNVTPSDAGQYSCHLDPTRPPYRRTRIPNCGQTLYVIGFQDISIQAEEVDNSGPVNLTCICRLRIYPDSVPTVSVTWRENDARLYSGGRNHMASSETWSYVYDGRQINHTSTLTIRDGGRGNDRYKCQAGVGEIQSEWSEEIVLINWSDDNKNYTVVPEGDDAMMTWKMPSLESGSYIRSPSGPHFMWTLSDKWNVGDTYTSRLQIKGVSPSSEFVVARLLLYNVTAADAGKYFCVSGYRRVPQCGHTLIVSRKPEKTHITATELTVVGENLTLSCSTTSRSLPRDHNLTMTYIWRRDNARLLSGGRHQVSGSTLKIADVREEDSGNYTCQGTEEGGQVSGWSSIFVLIVRQLSAATSPAMYIIIGCSTVVITVVALVVVALFHRRKTNRASSDVTWSRWDGLRHSSYEDVQMNRTLDDEEHHFSNDVDEDIQLADETQHLHNDVNEDIQLADETQQLNNDLYEDIQLADETQHLYNDVDEDVQLVDETQHLHNDVDEDIQLADETQHLHNDVYEDVQLADETQHLHNDVDEDVQLADETQHLHNDVDEDVQLADETQHLHNDVDEDIQLADETQHFSNDVDEDVQLADETQHFSNDVDEDIQLADETQHPHNDLYEDIQLADETQHLHNGVDEDIQLADETQHLHNDVDEDIQLADETQHLHNDVDEDIQLADETQHLSNDLYEDIQLADETQQLNNDLYEDIQLADETQHLSNDLYEDIQLADETQHLNNDLYEDIQLADETQQLNNDVDEDIQLADETQHLHNDVDDDIQLADETQHLNNDVDEDIQLADETQHLSNDVYEDVIVRG